MRPLPIQRSVALILAAMAGMSFHSATLAGQGDQCTSLGGWGTYDDRGINSSSELAHDLVHYFHSSQFSSLERAEGANFGGVVPVGDVLVGLNLEANREGWNQFQSETEEELTDRLRSSSRFSGRWHEISTGLLSIIRECYQQKGVHLRGSWASEDDSDSTFALDLRYQRSASGPSVAQLYLDFDGVTCTAAGRTRAGRLRVSVRDQQHVGYNCHRESCRAARITTSDVVSTVVEGEHIYIPGRPQSQCGGGMRDTAITILNTVAFEIHGGQSGSIVFPLPEWVHPGDIRSAELVLNARLDSNHFEGFNGCNDYDPRILFGTQEIRAPGCLWGMDLTPATITLNGNNAIEMFNAHLTDQIGLTVLLPHNSEHPINRQESLDIHDSSLHLRVKKPVTTTRLPRHSPR